MATPSITNSNVLQMLRSFLTTVLPSDVVVVQGQPNRAAAPSANRYVVMSQPRYSRLETNVDTSADALFTGSIAGTTLTITGVDSRFPTAELAVGTTVFGPGIAANTVITALGTGTGQLGTYVVNNSQNVASGPVSAGTTSVQMNALARVQLDFHSNDQTSADLANVVSTLMRDQYAIDQFANQTPHFDVTPIHADDAAQRPFLNDSQQVEFRWVVEALLQANIVITVPQQFADTAALSLKSVFAEFPT